jgi:hypothetical protein
MSKEIRRVEDIVDAEGWITTPGYTAWDCEKCKAEVRRYRGMADTDCTNCGACYTSGGQRLRDDWRDNPAWKYPDLEIGDMEGFELQQLAKEGDR